MRGMLFGDQILTDTERKNLSVLEAIREKGPLTKPEISYITKQNMVTISKYVKNFLENGLVLEKGLDISSGGRRAVIVELNSQAGFCLGVGLSSMHIIGIVTNLKAEVLSKIKQPRPKEKEDIDKRTQEVITQLIEESKVERSKIVGMGIACPSGIEVRDINALKEDFEQKFNLSCFVENEVSLASFGESWLGMEEDVKNIIYLHSLKGCGLIINGRVYRGTRQMAGRLDNPDLADIDLLSTLEGKESGKFKEIIKKLGESVASVINLLNPRMVIVGSGLEKIESGFLESLKDAIKRRATEEVSRDLEIVTSRLGEEASALGGAGLIIQHIFSSGKI